ncbi:MAG TPA: hypothetical protein VHR72_02045 [Gemmataceae bacterium]|nr:hypothetical protein [Gemmataceae bacterium]
MATFDDDARRWARTTLGMSAGDDPRFALLRKVKASGFNPPADVGVAFRVVSQPIGKLGDIGRVLESAGFVYERDQQRRQAVDAFAELFFALPIAERGVRFQALVAECAGDTVLESRVARLGRGLEIDIDRECLTPQEQRIVSIVRELFPLAPEERATRRRELVREAGRDRRYDTKTLDRLKASWPELARLDPDLWRKLEVAVEGWQPRRMQPVIEKAPGIAKSRPQQTSRDPWWRRGIKAWSWWYLVCIGSLVSLLRSCNESGVPPNAAQPDVKPAVQKHEADFKNQRETLEENLKRHREKKDVDVDNK